MKYSISSKKDSLTIQVKDSPEITVKENEQTGELTILIDDKEIWSSKK